MPTNQSPESENEAFRKSLFAEFGDPKARRDFTNYLTMIGGDGLCQFQYPKDPWKCFRFGTEECEPGVTCLRGIRSKAADVGDTLT